MPPVEHANEGASRPTRIYFLPHAARYTTGLFLSELPRHSSRSGIRTPDYNAGVQTWCAAFEPMRGSDIESESDDKRLLVLCTAHK